ncbi:MAG: hypothetical protein K0S65_5871, partial [Labilithrix sp.]|nr:hypothetical protein [Labilithrix sp.]
MTLRRFSADPSKAAYASMLRKARDESLSAEAEQRILAAITAPSPALAKPTAISGLRGLVAKGALGASFLALVTAAIVSRETRATTPPVAAPPVVSALPVVDAPPVPSSPVQAAGLSVHDLPSASVALIASAPVPTPSAVGEDSLGAEAALLRAVREDISSGRGEEALRKLDRYHARFGQKGAMREEASVERVEALLQTGADGDARTLGTRLLAERPDGPFARKLRSPHCTRDVMLDAPPLPPSPDSSAPGLFVAPDAGDKDASSDASGPFVAMCATTECPAPYATCAKVPRYGCETNLSNDMDNCGACGNSCRISLPPQLNAEMRCVDGECRSLCSPQKFLDCNGVPDDGCETDPTSDSKNCGGCGVECPPGVACIERRCGCPPGKVMCDGVCKDLSSDDTNCGACGYKCVDHPGDAGALPENMVWGCVDAQCGPKCASDNVTFWADCNGTKADGCEINLHGDRNNCGACGKKCAPGKDCYRDSNTGYIECRDPWGTCPPGHMSCPRWPGDVRCVDIENDRDNCG